MSNIIIVAGGTGGHIYPGLAIAEQIKVQRAEANIIFVGSHSGMEKNIIPHHGYPLELIRAMGFQRGVLKKINAVKCLFDSKTDAKKILDRYQPELVVGTGGFTCGVFLREAAKMGIPTLIHEQNAFPGKTNRALGKIVDKIAISFKESASYFPQEKTILTGNPVRDAFKNIDRKKMREALNIAEDEKFVVAFGGSQGAESINAAMTELMQCHADHVVYAQVTGKKNYEKIAAALEAKGIKNDHTHRIIAYTNEMEKYIGAADLIICRAGAITIAEVAAVGVPAIIVPYPFAAGDHQTVNAKAICESGGGIMIEDAALNGSVLKEKVDALLNEPETLLKMRNAVKKIGHIDADQIIAGNAIALIHTEA